MLDREAGGAAERKVTWAGGVRADGGQKANPMKWGKEQSIDSGKLDMKRDTEYLTRQGTNAGVRAWAWAWAQS